MKFRLRFGVEATEKEKAGTEFKLFFLVWKQRKKKGLEPNLSYSLVLNPSGYVDPITDL